MTSLFSICFIISFSHLASEENKLPNWINDCTCSRIFPWMSMWHVVVVDLENTIEKEFALLRCNPFTSLLATTTLIRHCRFSDLAQITVPSTYLRVLTTVPPILNPPFPLIPSIITVYKANKCREATHHCRTPCLRLIHSLMSSHISLQLFSSTRDWLTTGVLPDHHPEIAGGPPKFVFHHINRLTVVNETNINIFLFLNGPFHKPP